MTPLGRRCAVYEDPFASLQPTASAMLDTVNSGNSSAGSSAGTTFNESYPHIQRQRSPSSSSSSSRRASLSLETIPDATEDTLDYGHDDSGHHHPVPLSTDRSGALSPSSRSAASGEYHRSASPPPPSAAAAPALKDAWWKSSVSALSEEGGSLWEAKRRRSSSLSRDWSLETIEEDHDT